MKNQRVVSVPGRAHTGEWNKLIVPSWVTADWNDLRPQDAGSEWHGAHSCCEGQRAGTACDICAPGLCSALLLVLSHPACLLSSPCSGICCVPWSLHALCAHSSGIRLQELHARDCLSPEEQPVLEWALITNLSALLSASSQLLSPPKDADLQLRCW